MFLVEDLRNGLLEEIQETCLNFYHNPSLKKEAIISRVILFRTGMLVQRLLGLQNPNEGLVVQIRWKGVLCFKDALEPAWRVYKDDPGLFKKLLDRKFTSKDLMRKAKTLRSL